MSSDGQSHGTIQIWRSKVALGVWLLFLIVAVFGHVRAPEDFGDYVGTGQMVLAGKNIYSFAPNVQPPFFSLLCVPLALLSGVSSYLAVVSWSIFNCVAVLLLLDLGSRLAYGQTVALKASSAGISLTDPRIFVPILLTASYLIDNFQFHQINLIIFLMALGGLVWQQNGHPVRGGIAIGAAAAIKVMPILFVPYLAWRRQWRAAFATAVAAAGFSLSPLPIFGWQRFWSYVTSWLHVVQTSWDASGPNQSVYAMWDRILGHKLVPFLAPGAIPLPMSGEPKVRIAWALTLAVIGLAMLVTFRGSPWTDPFGQALEWSAVFLLAAIFGKITWKHYLVVMLLPNMLLYAVWRSRTADKRIREVAGAVLLICFVLALVTGGGLVGRSLALRLETGSVATDAVLIMLAGLLWLRLQRSGLNADARTWP